MENIKIFFIVSSKNYEGNFANEEIFHDYQEARDWAKKIQAEGEEVDSYIGTVAGAFQEEDGGWNYEDRAHVFNSLYTVDLLKAYQGHS